MKKVLIIFIAISFLLTIPIAWLVYYDNKTGDFFVNKENTAIEIAKLIMLEHYPDMNMDNEDVKISDEGEYWRIYFYPKPIPGYITFDGGCSIELRKDGKVLYFQLDG